MNRNRLRALVDGVLILVSLIMLLCVVCWSVSVFDWPGWIRFVNALPLPGKLKMWLWGWF